MRHFSADALVLRAVDRGDNDKLITLLTAKEGRFYAIVKGAHSLKREVAATEPYTWSNLEFYEKNGVRWVKTATAQETFPGLRYDPDKLFLAAYICDVAAELSGEREPAGEILPLTLNTLYKIAFTQGDDDRLKAAFEMRAAAVSGFRPDLSQCGRCRAPVAGDVYLDVMAGALVCAKCLNAASRLAPVPEVDELGGRSILVPLTASAAVALDFVVRADAKRVFSFTLKDAGSLAAFSRAAETYLLHHLERGFPTLDNYKKLREAARPAPAPTPQEG